jgi:hypothetical protein
MLMMDVAVALILIDSARVLNNLGLHRATSICGVHDGMHVYEEETVLIYSS